MLRFLRSLKHAGEGIMHAVQSERHMRFHITAAVIVCMMASALKLNPVEWAILMLAAALVIVAELVNTAIERVVDLTSPDLHPLAKLAKDTAAGAVLVAAFFSILIGIVVMGPPLVHMLVGGSK